MTRPFQLAPPGHSVPASLRPCDIGHGHCDAQQLGQTLSALANLYSVAAVARGLGGPRRIGHDRIFRWSTFVLPPPSLHSSLLHRRDAGCMTARGRMVRVSATAGLPLDDASSMSNGRPGPALAVAISRQTMAYRHVCIAGRFATVPTITR